MKMKNGVKDFTQLDAWKMARQLRSEIYKASKIFPRDETYALISQMRRSAISVTANFAEGYLRYSVQENMQFCRQSRASAYDNDWTTERKEEQLMQRAHFPFSLFHFPRHG